MHYNIKPQSNIEFNWDSNKIFLTVYFLLTSSLKKEFFFCDIIVIEGDINDKDISKYFRYKKNRK